jgi:hypothetical protein
MMPFFDAISKPYPSRSHSIGDAVGNLDGNLDGVLDGLSDGDFHGVLG